MFRSIMFIGFNLLSIILVILGCVSMPLIDTYWLGRASYFALNFLIVELYFLPTLIALHRSISSFYALLFVNVIFGWTGIGWFALLIWAGCGTTLYQERLVKLQLTMINGR